MSDTAPPWLLSMRAATGTSEVPGTGSNPKIVAAAQYIAATFPDVDGLQAYCDLYTDDSIAWCGLAAAWACATAGILGPFGDIDTDRFLWAQSWASDDNFIKIGAPVLGCIVVMTRSGGGHVTLYESDAGSNIKCRGGNQSDAINVASYPKSSVIAYVWPKDVPLPPMPRRNLSKGDTGPDVAALQALLGIPADGDFGSITESAVKSFQRATGLAADGVVGPATWKQLDTLEAAVIAGNDGLSPQQIDAIVEVAEQSDINHYSWDDRGTSPPGYISGMALTFALAVTMYHRDEEAAVIMAGADSGDPDTDALTWYSDEFDDEEMDNSVTGTDTLRHLFALMIGLGMRESSGNCWEGRDMSASNVSSDTCEAGLFQTSWNIRSCAPEAMNALLEHYWGDPNGFNETFRRGLNPTAAMLDIYGSGAGAQYQWLSRYAPAFHALVTGVGMRLLRQHWGPINRHEVELRSEADEMLQQVQQIIEEGEPLPIPPPEPEPEQAVVSISVQGNVIIIVNGQEIES